jgi:hypothetical protein
MFARRFWPGRFFAPRYWPQSQGVEPPTRQFPTSFRVSVVALGVSPGLTRLSTSARINPSLTKVISL